MNKEGFLKIPFSVIRNEEYSKWSGTSEAKVWQYLMSYIVRSPKGNNFTRLLYNKYHENGMLVSRWDQKDIAKNIGLKSASYISELLSSMAKKGIIKKHSELWNGKSLCVYEFGVYNEKQGEVFYAFTYFKKIKAEKELARFGKYEVSEFGKYEVAGFGKYEPIIE